MCTAKVGGVDWPDLAEGLWRLGLGYHVPVPIGRVFANAPDSACVIGLRKKVVAFSSVTELKKETDFEHRMPREQWWLNLRLMLKMLAHYRISMADYVSGELEHVTRRTLSIDKGF